jgi:putative pyruvate formate lyase activating enzyme
MALEHFKAVRDGEALPRFWISRQLSAVAATGEDSWKCHHRVIEQGFLKSTFEENDAAHSLLDLKIELATRCFDSCDLCPHHCHVNRNQGKVGYCGVAGKSAVHWEGVLYGEERELVPSHEVFFSGCTMRCAFCYSHHSITKPMNGQVFDAARLARLMEKRFAEGATNCNLVGGDPMVHIPTVLRALRELRQPIPIVWNSNMYATAPAMELLNGVVDLFVGDIHFGNDECAEKLGRIPDYSASVRQAFRAAARSGASVIIRHLVMPGHLECCARPAMEWAVRELPEVPFHLMFQYLPDFRAQNDPVLGRPLSQDEIIQAQQIAREPGVHLYQNTDREKVLFDKSTFGHSNRSEEIGETQDIVIHPDGRVVCMRLTEAMLPVMQEMSKSTFTQNPEPETRNQ